MKICLLVRNSLLVLLLLCTSVPLYGYVLVDNWVDDGNGNWVTSGGYWSKDSFYHYNCYAYAIEMPAYSYQYPPAHRPGIFSGGMYSRLMPPYNLASLARADLESLGYSAWDSGVEPANLVPGQSLICVRTGYNPNAILWSWDYHFMRKSFGDEYWYHKPGSSAILKYKHQNPADKDWISESCSENGESLGGTVYSSEIYYIVYGPPTIARISFHSNYGENKTTQFVQKNTSTLLVSNTFERTGYTLAGWTANANGTGTFYANGASITINADIDLYAVWTGSPYTVYLSDDPGGGGPASVIAIYGSPMPAITAAIPARQGFSFGGYFDIVGTKYYDDNLSSVKNWDKTINGTTLYARWLPIPNYNYQIGDSGPGGGTIFYKKSAYSDGWRYLEAAPFETEVEDIWDLWMSYSKILNYGSYGDWYLPNIYELELIYLSGLGNFSSDYYWSSDYELACGGHYILVFNFDYGSIEEFYVGGMYEDDIAKIRSIRAF